MPPRDRTKRRALPRQDRALASSAAILTAAEQLLQEEGFARMTTNRIAVRAGVNVSLLYRYFAGKEAIVGALIERVAAATEHAVQQVLREHVCSSLPVAVRALLEVLVATPGAPALHRELVESIEITKRRLLLKDLRERLGHAFAAFMHAREHELKALADPDATLFVLGHAIEAATHAAAFYRPESLPVARVLDALTIVVVRALLPADRQDSQSDLL